MKATKYFRKKSDLTNYAKAFKSENVNNWYLRTTLYCDHAVDGKRPGIVLIANETIVQRLILCRTCNVHGNSVEMHAYVESLTNELS